MHLISGTEEKARVPLRVRWAATLLSAAGFSLGGLPGIKEHLPSLVL